MWCGNEVGATGCPVNDEGAVNGVGPLGFRGRGGGEDPKGVVGAKG
jgi:hypothetical protein